MQHDEIFKIINTTCSYNYNSCKRN